jgi:hypothetical protein
MKKIFLLTLLSFLGYSDYSKAQSSLGVDTSGNTIPGFVYFNNTYSFKVNIKNYGPQNYNNNVLEVEYYLVDTTGAFIFLTRDSLPNISIPSNGTYLDTVNIYTDSSKFRSGINTVVIWPRYSTYTTHDSLRVQIWLFGYAGIENYTLGKLILFPNPAQHILYVANNSPNFVIEQVRIYDVLGQPVYAEPFKGFLDVSKFSSGAYTLEFLDKNGRVSRYKVIKE